MAVPSVSGTPDTVTLFDPRWTVAAPLLEKVVIPLNSLGPSARSAVLPDVMAWAQIPTPPSSPWTIEVAPWTPMNPCPLTPVCVPSPTTPQRPLPRTPASCPEGLVPHNLPVPAPAATADLAPVFSAPLPAPAGAA